MKKEESNALKRLKMKDIVSKILNKDKKKKLKQKDIFEKVPKNSHLMKDGKTIMSGSRHSKDSKVIGKLSKAKSKIKKKKLYNPISKKQY
tara:strand:+ start:858 stop:1127 length:270 start_codon:yes stop_codon:yes gene_type:complete